MYDYEEKGSMFYVFCVVKTFLNVATVQAVSQFAQKTDLK